MYINYNITLKHLAKAYFSLFFMKQPICITFAAPVGSSKTPISNYLSGKLNLPIYNNEAARSEIIEDKGFLDEKNFTKRLEVCYQKIKNILKDS